MNQVDYLEDILFMIYLFILYKYIKCFYLKYLWNRMESSLDHRNIRLLYLLKTLQIGGAEKSTILYSNELVNKIKFVGILAGKGFYDSSNIISNKVFRFYPPHKIKNYFYFFNNLIFLFKTLKLNEISILHYHQRIFIPFVYFIKLLFPKINIIYSHQNVFNDWKNYFIFAGKIIALTKAAKNDLPKFLQNKITIIPHGTILPKKVTTKTMPSQFGFVGRFIKWKGIMELIDEFKIVNKKYPFTKLFLVGDGPQKEEILKKIKKIDLGEKIYLIEPQNNLAKIYNLLDVIILPSKFLEGFGIVLIEAMSYGIPAIVFDNPVFKEIVINNINGIVVKRSLSEGMLKLLYSQTLFKKLSINAKKSSFKYDLNVIVNRCIQEIYINN